MAERRVLVVAAHPDDEVLGAGATMAMHALEGDSVHVLIMATGAASRQSGPGAANSAIGHLEVAARRASEVLGASDVSLKGLPDNQMDSMPLLEVVRHVEAEIERVRPDIVYTHHVGDLNIDHEVTCRAVVTATRPIGGRPPDVYSFEVRSSTDWAEPLVTAPAFRPNVWCVVSDEAAAMKARALEAYTVEMRPWPHSRSTEAVTALLRHRGAQVGAPAAEAFMLLRSVRASP